MIVYLCTNTINNEKYVGITSKGIEHRKRAHKCNALTKKSPNHLYRSIRKYGWEFFDWEIIDSSADNYEELLEKEIFYISKYDTFNNGYNMTIGGDGSLGYRHTDETKKKISYSTKGIPKGPMSPSHFEKISKINKSKIGKTYDELYGQEKSTELRIAASQRAKKFHSDNDDHREWLSGSLIEKFGNDRAIEIKQKMSDIRKNLLVDGKRVDLSDAGRRSIVESKSGTNNPNFVSIDSDKAQLIVELYKKYGKIVPEILIQSGYSKHVIKRFLKEINLYAGRKKYQDGDCDTKRP